jgi:hypothetical protein
MPVKAIIGRFAGFATKTMPFGRADAAPEPVLRADHPAADVLGVTEAAECGGLELGRGRRAAAVYVSGIPARRSPRSTVFSRSAR